jgi:hypothetical protein
MNSAEEVIWIYYVAACGMAAVWWVGYLLDRNRLFLSMAVVFTLGVLLSGCATIWDTPLKLQQEPQACTATAVVHALAAEPLYRDVDGETARMLFKAANGYDTPSVVRAGVRAGVCRGSVSIGSLEGLKRELEWGPVVLTFPFYNSMNELDRFGCWLVETESIQVGRHTSLVIGYSGGMFTILNSWGWMWGSGGKCFVWEEDMQRLFDGGAEGWIVY